mmetsp:Transcript_34220/g.101694  ORF Transcript_34220/g.101694 Transcript_34220/m.101694 type:complete len:237 (-) Transcript_34220:375-1085(-)
MMNWTKVETGEPRRDGSSRSRNCTVKERERPSSATYSWASAIALVVTSTGTGPLVVMETSSPSRTRPAIAPASLKQSVLSLTVRSSSDGSRSMISAARCSSYETFDDWRMSPSKVGLMTISTGPPVRRGAGRPVSSQEEVRRRTGEGQERARHVRGHILGGASCRLELGGRVWQTGVGRVSDWRWACADWSLGRVLRLVLGGASAGRRRSVLGAHPCRQAPHAGTCARWPWPCTPG